jgi:hypothetical protein
MKKLQRDEHHVVVCGCGDTAHHLLFTLDSDEPEVWLHYQLELKPWYKRLWIGIKYIFGYQSKYGTYGELSINETNIHNFEKIVEHVKGKKENE